ncbi:uncharacterized protein TM35_000411740 [Trypanosoma theileri]|uniref:Mitochondrial RNA binding complex 1 subunit n=1 Tax=Trypanosoma theileri TaxID=67003 RepID=A0A1X0NJ60_9TRYP|nr:uncharacterized protein TM35_000411740 [Trypanosoma theileri]ORC84804.1 hypothetical protein TM35_000411740 [Trypanosoma theileri]
MYRRYSRGVVNPTVFHPIITSAVAWCSSGKDPSEPPKPRRTVRRVLPSDEEMAELHNVDREAAAAVHISREESLLASVSVEPMRFASTADISSRMREDPFSDPMDDDHDDNAVEEGVHSYYNGMNEMEREENTLLRESHSTKASPPIDILLQQQQQGEEEEGNVNASTAYAGVDKSYGNEFHTDGSASRILERQEYLRTVEVTELVEILVLYLRATENKRLVSAEEEHVLFPVIMDRLNELHIQQMLDIVECHWARSTLVRYGIKFKDMVRDRIAVIASTAAKGASQEVERVKDTESNPYNDNDDDMDDGAVYIHEVKKNTLDPILLNARDEMNAEGVLRCIIVMGMSAGRRKRDLQFFQALGIFLVHHINRYKDPQDLVRVLTAFARAKIIPPKGFLALLGRRFAVLNKRKPLGALPSYRALVNLYKMGHDQMNSFKFLANCIYETIETNIKNEKKHERLIELQRKKEEKEKEEDAQLHSSSSSSTTTTNMNTVNQTLEKKSADTAAIIGDLDPQLLVVVRARERFKRLTELKPSMFTKLLLVLARFGAPHQQYLRPTIKPLILPMLGSFPPPSFSRLLRAMRLFRTTDLELIDPIINYIVDDIGAAAVLSEDILELLRIISPPDVPVPQNLTKFITLCEQVYSNKDEHLSRPIRPNEMCAVAAVLLQIQRKDDIPLEALDPLTRLMENFAGRLRELMKLHVVSLTHVDIFTDLCRQQQHPDISGNISALSKERREVSINEGDDEYYSHLDIDVRETFHKMMLVNDYNTYGQYRPTPGVLQVDFKQALTEVSAFDVLEATHLFAQAFPNALQPTVERHLSRSILAKLGNSGEEVITPEHTVVLRPPRELLLTKGDLLKFVELLQLTPLKRVKTSTLVWRFVEEKAKRLKMMEVLEKAKQQQVEASQLSV